MAESRQVAGFVGPVLVAVTLSEIVNPGIWANVSAPDTYQAGLLWFVAGLTIVRVHNRWSVGWPVMVTISGWFAVVMGLSRMFATQAAMKGAANPSVVLALTIGLLFAGLFLCFKAYVKT